MEADNIAVLAKTLPVDALPKFIGFLAEASAIANMRLLAPAPRATAETLQLIDRKEAAKVLGVSVFFLEGKTLPCQQRAGRKILYDRRKLEQYIRAGNVPYQNRRE